MRSLPKMHHALVDGVAAIDIGTVSSTRRPSPWTSRPETRSGRRSPTTAAATWRACRRAGVRAQRLLIDAAQRALAAPTRAAPPTTCAARPSC